MFLCKFNLIPRFLTWVSVLPGISKNSWQALEKSGNSLESPGTPGNALWLLVWHRKALWCTKCLVNALWVVFQRLCETCDCVIYRSGTVETGIVLPCWRRCNAIYRGLQNRCIQIVILYMIFIFGTLTIVLVYYSNCCLCNDNVL